MKTKGAKVCLGLLLLAGLILLVSNVSFAGDNDPSWGPGMTAYDKGKDGQGPDLPFNLFNASLQLPPRTGFYDGRNRDQNDRGNHYGWDRGNHHHHPSPCK